MLTGQFEIAKTLDQDPGSNILASSFSRPFTKYSEERQKDCGQGDSFDGAGVHEVNTIYWETFKMSCLISQTLLFYKSKVSSYWRRSNKSFCFQHPKNYGFWRNNWTNWTVEIMKPLCKRYWYLYGPKILYQHSTDIYLLAKGKNSSPKIDFSLTSKTWKSRNAEKVSL